MDFDLKSDLQGWLEDKLPKIQMQPIALSSNETRGVLVIYVPASGEAPHQAKDGKFYTRIGSKLHALSTRSIFDVANRRVDDWRLTSRIWSTYGIS